MKGQFLVIVIESAAVCASLVEYAGSKKADMLCTATDHISPRHGRVGSHVEHAMLRSLSNVLKALEPRAKRLTKVHIVFSSPWILSKTKIASFQYQKPVTVDKRLLDGIIAEERTALRKLFPFDVDLIEQKIFEVKVNGFPIKNKKPSPAMTLSIANSVSVVSKHIIKKVTETVEKHFHSTKSSFHSASLLSFISMRYIRPEFENGIFIHVHGECTDITIFVGGVPLYFSSLNYGVYSFYRALAEKIGMTFDLAASKVSLYEKGDLSTAEHKKFEPVVREELLAWYDDILKLIFQYDRIEELPLHIIVHSSKQTKLFEQTLADQNRHSKISRLPEEITELYMTGIDLVEFRD